MSDVMVLKQIRLAPLHYRLTLAAPEAAREARPGQFLHVRCGETLDPLLRRPISIHAVDREKGELSLLYRVAGRGTALLSEKKKGDTISLLGPLGRGFTMPSVSEKVSVVAGGIGIAPLYFLLQEIGARGQAATVFWGAATREQFFSPAAPGQNNDGAAGRCFSVMQGICEQGHKIFQASDDGSVGFHGTITDLFEQYLNSHRSGEAVLSRYGNIVTDHEQFKLDQVVSRVYGCGPRGMLKGLCGVIRQEEIPGEVSLEERMGCGVGACLSCACKTRDEKDGFQYRRVCVEGPVFSAREVVWD
jgi:dihydroorotate dehydrogenase electron transfer subunit